MENPIVARDSNPGRRDPFRLQFGAPDEGDIIRTSRKKKYRQSAPKGRRKRFHFDSAYRHEGVPPVIYADSREENYYDYEDNEREWQEEVVKYLRHKRRKFIGRLSGRHLRRIGKMPLSASHRGKLIYPKRVIPGYNNEFYEESYNPNDYVERRYRPGFEGGYGYPRMGNYGPYGESAPEFEEGLHSDESASPYGAGYQVGASYEGEHGYGSTEDLGKGRSSY